MTSSRSITLAIVVVAIVSVIFVIESQRARRPDGADVVTVAPDARDRVPQAGFRTVEEKAAEFERAKEITTPDGFLNTGGASVEIADYVGKQVVLVDFWTYSCINCQRTIPYLNAWHERYADKGLVIIGVHTPEFEFEKKFENVAAAVEKFGITYPVVLDNDYSTWAAYRNRYWPRKYLVDIDGFIVYDHIGEGAYDQTEREIVTLLNERSAVLDGGAVEVAGGSVAADVVDFSQIRTPETYLGYGRSEHLLNPLPDECTDRACDFEKPAAVGLNSYALSGRWKTEREAITLTDGVGDVTIRFSASKVNFVGGVDSGTVRAEIILDGQRIDHTHAGSDVKGGEVLFGMHDLYNLVNLRGAYEEHELTIRFLTPGVQAFAFTFG